MSNSDIRHNALNLLCKQIGSLSTCNLSSGEAIACLAVMVYTSF